MFTDPALTVLRPHPQMCVYSPRLFHSRLYRTLAEGSRWPWYSLAWACK